MTRMPWPKVGQHFSQRSIGARAILAVLAGAAVLAAPSVAFMLAWHWLVGGATGLFFWLFILYIFAPLAGLVFAAVLRPAGAARRVDQAAHFALLAPAVPTVGIVIAIGVVNGEVTAVAWLVPLLAGFWIVGGFFARTVGRLLAQRVFGRSGPSADMDSARTGEV
jgi:hypothetical protein